MLVDRFIKARLESEEAKSKTISVLKSISWRIVGTLDTMVISFIITGRAEVAMSIASIEVASKMLLYYLHERVWEGIKEGKKAL